MYVAGRPRDDLVMEALEHQCCVQDLVDESHKEMFIIKVNVSTSEADDSCGLISMGSSTPGSPLGLSVVALLGMYVLRPRHAARRPSRLPGRSQG